jgi:hypothetical protein
MYASEYDSVGYCRNVLNVDFFIYNNFRSVNKFWTEDFSIYLFYFILFYFWSIVNNKLKTAWKETFIYLAFP